MDKATIDAMRTVVNGLLSQTAHVEIDGFTGVNGFGWMPIVDYRAAVEGLRTLIDEAAERAEGVVVKDASEADRLLDDLLYALEQVTREAEKNGDTHIQFKAKNYSYAMYTHNARATILAIEAMTAAQPAKVEPAKPAEPTLKECAAAINRAGHRGHRDWEAGIVSKAGTHWLNADEVRALGAYYSERERADAAKGGA